MNGCHSNCEKASDKNVSSSFPKKSTSILSSIAILLLPKCPFCVVAYTSAVTLCSASGVLNETHHHTDWGGYAAAALCIIITACILFTYKIERGLKPFIITSLTAVAGSALIIIGVFNPSSMWCYYIGALLMIIAAMMYSNIFKAAYQLIQIKIHQRNTV